MKIHDEIDNYLAADLHGELSDEEQNALHVHLVECASCRQAHQESKIMNKVLEEKFANEQPDAAFEQRMLAEFRNRIPQKNGSVAKFIVDLMRLRATQVAAVAAVLLALVQVGRMITGEGAIRRNELANSVDLYQRSAATPSSNGRTEADADFKTEQRAKLAKADALQKITAFANEERGYVATTSSEKQANGKLKGQIIVKVLPENLDRFLQKLRGLGELKNQTLGTKDITKAYFDTDARLKNARVMEQRLIDMLKKKSDDINDLLQVEKELGRVREQIEQMQGELKFFDSQVQFATVTISLAEKDMEEPAKFLLKERAQLALYTPEVEKVYNDLKGLASSKVQITNAQLDRDNSGRVSARASLLIAPEESDALIAKTKAMGRVENFQVQTERVAQGGEGMSENAKTKRDKVALNITISRDEQEQAFQQTTLRIRTSTVDEKAKKLRDLSGNH